MADASMRSAEDLLISPGDFEAETASANVVEIYPLETEEGGARNDKGLNHGKTISTPPASLLSYEKGKVPLRQ